MGSCTCFEIMSPFPLSLSLSLFLSEVSTYIQFFVILVIKIFAYACWLSPVVHTVPELCLVFAFLFLFPFIHWLLRFWEVHWWVIELGVRGRERERALVERWPLCRLWHCCDRERERKLVTYTHTCLLSLPLFMEYDSTKERSVSHGVVATCIYVLTIHHVLTEVIRLYDYNSYTLPLLCSVLCYKW